MNPLLWGTDVFVTEVPGVYESTEAILQPHPHTNALARTAAIIKVLPHLHVHVHVHNYITYIYLTHVHVTVFM